MTRCSQEFWVELTSIQRKLDSYIIINENINIVSSHRVLICARYQEKYGKNLRVEIRDETGGNFETALLTWLMGADPTGQLEPTLQYYSQLYPSMNSIQEVTAYIALLNKAIVNAKVCRYYASCII